MVLVEDFVSIASLCLFVRIEIAVYQIADLFCSVFCLHETVSYTNSTRVCIVQSENELASDIFNIMTDVRRGKFPYQWSCQ